MYMVQWLIIHLYIHRTSVVNHFKLYKLTFFLFVCFQIDIAHGKSVKRH